MQMFTYIFLLFQVIRCFSFYRHIAFVTHLDYTTNITFVTHLDYSYVYIHNKTNISEKAKLNRGSTPSLSILKF